MPTPIGLVGGIGPAATDYYYRHIIASMARRGIALDLTMVHADQLMLRRHWMTSDPAAQVAIYLGLAERLRRAGAQAMAITSIAGHFCITPFKAVSPLPVIDLLETVGGAVAAGGYDRVGLIGTGVVMQSRFYGALTGAEVLVPEGPEFAQVNDAYVAMAAAGRVTEAQRSLFFAAGEALVARGAQTVLLGGTDLPLAFDGRDCGFATVDCAGVHAEAIVEVAAAGSAPPG